ncbi:hypothetical protein GE09DRAFT_1062349 [Coniochaeta sp. 2T2.1]|nr:hypothetical protein GE09DRAFT_1062349 [Coniochaeta sp. 2T2.1]
MYTYLRPIYRGTIAINFPPLGTQLAIEEMHHPSAPTPSLCDTCTAVWQAQTCNPVSNAHDFTNCWPPRSGDQASLDPGVMMGWGLYSPGIVCPAGYTTAAAATAGGSMGWGVEYRDVDHASYLAHNWDSVADFYPVFDELDFDFVIGRRRREGRRSADGVTFLIAESLDRTINPGAKAGIGIGVTLGAVLLLALAIFLFRRSKRNNTSTSSFASPPPPGAMALSEKRARRAQAELPSSEEVRELDGRPVVTELPTRLPSDRIPADRKQRGTRFRRSEQGWVVSPVEPGGVEGGPGGGDAGLVVSPVAPQGGERCTSWRGRRLGLLSWWGGYELDE